MPTFFGQFSRKPGKRYWRYVALCFLPMWFPRLVDFQEFSLSGFAKNRIFRCFLRFSGFAENGIFWQFRRFSDFAENGIIRCFPHFPGSTDFAENYIFWCFLSFSGFAENGIL